jgi:hypothetical protein
MPTARANGTPREYPPQAEAAEPILCRCRRWRRGLLGDHHDHLAELERNRTAGAIPDEATIKGPVAP